MADATLTPNGQRIEAIALLQNISAQISAQHRLVDINALESDALAAVGTEITMQLRRLGVER